MCLHTGISIWMLWQALSSIPCDPIFPIELFLLLTSSSPPLFPPLVQTKFTSPTSCLVQNFYLSFFPLHILIVHSGLQLYSWQTCALESQCASRQFYTVLHSSISFLAYSLNICISEKHRVVVWYRARNPVKSVLQVFTRTLQQCLCYWTHGLAATMRHRKRMNYCWMALCLLLLSIPCCIISSLQQMLITVISWIFWKVSPTDKPKIDSLACSVVLLDGCSRLYAYLSKGHPKHRVFPPLCVLVSKLMRSACIKNPEATLQNQYKVNTI